jgi:hypothetical protein
MLNELLLAAALNAAPAAQTPGVARFLSTARICEIKWGADRRHVSIKLRKLVFAAYGIDWENRDDYELDHLIPRELGGADVFANLWPEPWPDAHVKDHEENALHRAVCRGEMKLKDAQEQMRSWER